MAELVREWRERGHPILGKHMLYVLLGHLPKLGHVSVKDAGTTLQGRR